jgi:uncharacterized protein YndB with AHSA1/START domain
MALDPGSPTGATVEHGDDRWTLVFVRELRHPPATVWTALTDPAEIGQWAPFTAARDLGHPGAVTLTMVDGDEKADLPGRVLRAEPPSLLEYTWGDDLLRWELEPSGDGTRLVLRHTSAERGGEAMVAAGWHLCAVVLGRLLDGDPAGVVRGEAARRHGWAQLRDGYAAQFSR